MPKGDLALKKWLEIDATAIFDRFTALGGGTCVDRGAGDERFVYVPGSRADRVVLIAHADTVWDDDATYPRQVLYQEGVYTSRNPAIGIGADDHAGCALVWTLRDLGHSLLILAGEEKGCVASNWLAVEHPEILAELNAHRFLVQFDRQGKEDFKCYDVGTNAFREYVQAQTGYTEPDRKSATDIRVLARSICGVNLSVGYYDEHTPDERLVYADWAHTLRITRTWLEPVGLPRFLREDGCS